MHQPEGSLTSPSCSGVGHILPAALLGMLGAAEHLLQKGPHMIFQPHSAKMQHSQAPVKRPFVKLDLIRMMVNLACKLVLPSGCCSSCWACTGLTQDCNEFAPIGNSDQGRLPNVLGMPVRH